MKQYSYDCCHYEVYLYSHLITYLCLESYMLRFWQCVLILDLESVCVCCNIFLSSWSQR